MYLCGASGWLTSDESAGESRMKAAWLDAMMTHVLPLEQVQHGSDIAATKADSAIKVELET